jgi:hypothetical protein
MFEAECVQNKVLLKWATASEINNDYFTIEQSIDRFQFESIATIQGTGSSSTILNYEFTDFTFPSSTILYYRLKQTDFDGKFEYSQIVATNCTLNKIGNIKVYPNPVSNELTIEITGNTVPVNFEIFDVLGSVIYQGNLMEKVTVQTSNFAHGVYLVKLENGKIFEFKKIIK